MTSIFVFDAYGTLFDVHAAVARHRAQAGPSADRVSAIWRTKQLEYTWTLTLAGHYADFWVLTERALDYALALVPSVDKSLKPMLLDSYFRLDAFPDARMALQALKAKGRKTARTAHPPCSRPQSTPPRSAMISMRSCRSTR
jgi:2-haloacid dehalogenase